MRRRPRAEENKMGVMPIPKLLWVMSGPMMVSMLVQALYNVVDSMFVSYLSQDALTAVGLAFPVQNLMIAVSGGTCVGINAVLSRSLGEKDFDMANRAANNGILLNFLSYLVFAVIGIFGSEIFFAIQVDTPATIAYGRDYMFYICILSFGLFGQMVLSRLLQSTGRTFPSMIIQLVGAVVNIILDPILIFGLLGFPAMGVAGAAIATGIGQLTGTALGIYFNLRHNPEIVLSLRGMLPSSRVVRQIYSVGVPSIIMQTISSIMFFGINLVLVRFTETASTVFGVYFKIQGFFFMPVFGLNNGVVPIVAYNYGARRPDRIDQTVKLAIWYAVGIMMLGLLAFQIFPTQLLGIFQAGEEMLKIGVPALRILSVCFIAGGFTIVCSSLFQALGRGFLSMSISVVRQLVVLVPVAFLLSLAGNLTLVWVAFPIAEVFSATMAIFYLRMIHRKVIEPLGRTAEQQEEALANGRETARKREVPDHSDSDK